MATATVTCRWRRAWSRSCCWACLCELRADAVVVPCAGIQDDGRPPPSASCGCIFAAALLAVFSLQEWIESWVAPGHPAGSRTSRPTSAGSASRSSIVLGGAGRSAAATVPTRRYAAIACRRLASLRRLRPAARRGRSLPFPDRPRLDVLAGNRAGRAPPARLLAERERARTAPTPVRPQSRPFAYRRLCKWAVRPIAAFACCIATACCWSRRRDDAGHQTESNKGVSVTMHVTP